MPYPPPGPPPIRQYIEVLHCPNGSTIDPGMTPRPIGDVAWAGIGPRFFNGSYSYGSSLTGPNVAVVAGLDLVATELSKHGWLLVGVRTHSVVVFGTLRSDYFMTTWFRDVPGPIVAPSGPSPLLTRDPVPPPIPPRTGVTAPERRRRR